jgi:UPF0755 protein
MSEQEYDDHPVEGGRRRKRRRWPGCLAALVALAVLVGGFYVAVTRGVDYVSDRLNSTAEDYEGPGRGKVSFEVAEGDTTAAIGRKLKAEGVTASVDAFLEAAAAEEDATSIQAGFYRLKKRMPAEDALAVLVDSENRVTAAVTVPEGLRVVDVVELLGQETKFPASAYERVLEDPGAIGLPSYADGNAEGYLFPATYEIDPRDKPRTILSAMVDRWEQAAEEADLEARAEELGYSPDEIMVIASLVEAEGRGSDMPRIARVIYNRLEGPGNQRGTNGLLQIDASVNYGLDQKLGVTLTEEQKAVDTPYNTYLNPGLPPTPIEAPGDRAIDAATHPADGDWYYYVTVNLRTGETKFAETYDEFLGYRREYQEYCEGSDAC